MVAEGDVTDEQLERFDCGKIPTQVSKRDLGHPFQNRKAAPSGIPGLRVGLEHVPELKGKGFAVGEVFLRIGAWAGNPEKLGKFPKTP